MQMEQPVARPLYTYGSLGRLILPIMVEQALAMTIGLADVVMIAWVGEAAVSGISLVDSLNNLVIQVLVALCAGGAVVAAQYLGREQQADARSAATQLIAVVTLVASALSLLCLLGNRGLLLLLFGHLDAQVMHNARVYFYLSAASFPFIAVYNSVAGIFRSMGNSKAPMLTSLLMNVVHIAGNAATIYWLKWGTAGVGIASLVSRALAAVALYLMLQSRHYPVWIEFTKKFRFDREMLKRILNIGIPNGLENGMFQLGRLLTQGVVAGLGTAAIAANAIAVSLSNIIMVPGFSAGLATITVVGRCMGAGVPEQANTNLKRMAYLSYACKVVLLALTFLLADAMVGAFRVAPDTARIAKTLLLSFAIAQTLLYTPSFLFAHALRATGDVRFPMAVSILSMWTLRVGLSHLLAVRLGLGVLGVWCAMYIDWMARSIAFVPRWHNGRWRTLRVI